MCTLNLYQKTMTRNDGSTFVTTFCLIIGIISVEGRVLAPETCPDNESESKQNICTHHAYSCFMRCGTTPVGHFMSASEDLLGQCACDERCNIYNDCCWDFNTLCQKELEISVTKYSHLSGAGFEESVQLHTVVDVCNVKSSFTATTISSTFETNGYTIRSPPINRDRFVPIQEQEPITKLQRLHRKYMHVLDQTSGVMYKNEEIYNCFKIPDSVKVFVPRLLVVDYTSDLNIDIESRIDIDESLNLNVIDLPYRKNHCQSNIYLSVCKDALVDYNLVHTENDSLSLRVCRPRRVYCSFNQKPTRANELLETTIGLQRVGNKDEAYLLIALKEFWKILYCSNPQLHFHECQVLQCADYYLPLDARTCFKPNLVEILVSESEVAIMNASEKVENFKPAPPCICLKMFSAFQNVFLWRSNRLHPKYECTFTNANPASAAFEEAEKEGVSILDILNRSVTISEINRSGIDRIQLKHLDTLSQLQNEIKLQFLSHYQCDDPYPLVHACFIIDANIFSGTAAQHLRAEEMLKANGENVKCFSFHRNQSNKIQSLFWLVVIIVLSVL